MEMGRNGWFQIFQLITILILGIWLVLTQNSLTNFLDGVTYIELKNIGNMVIFIGSGCVILTMLQFGIMWYKLLYEE